MAHKYPKLVNFISSRICSVWFKLHKTTSVIFFSCRVRHIISEICWLDGGLVLQVVVDFNCKRFDSYLQILRAGFGVRVRHGREVEVGFIG